MAACRLKPSSATECEHHLAVRERQGRQRAPSPLGARRWRLTGGGRGGEARETGTFARVAVLLTVVSRGLVHESATAEELRDPVATQD